MGALVTILGGADGGGIPQKGPALWLVSSSDPERVKTRRRFELDCILGLQLELLLRDKICANPPIGV